MGGVTSAGGESAGTGARRACIPEPPAAGGPPDRTGSPAGPPAVAPGARENGTTQALPAATSSGRRLLTSGDVT